MPTIFCNGMDFEEKKPRFLCNNKALYELPQYPRRDKRFFSCGKCLNRILREKLVFPFDRIIKIKVLEKKQDDTKAVK